MKKRLSLLLGVILALALLAIPALAVDGSPVSSEADLQAAAASGGSYYLADDIKLTEVLNVGTTLTLDLNGHTVEQTGSRTIDWCETDNLPWDDQYDDEAYGCVKGQRQQNLSAICLRGGANLTVNATGGGEIVSKNNGIDYNYTEAAQGMTLVVNGAEITGANYAIYSVDDEVDVTISGGICNGKVGASLITGGEFNGFTEVETAVTGGIFNGELKIGGLDEISNCTINGVFNWYDKDGAIPALNNVTFGENASITTNQDYDSKYRIEGNSIVKKQVYTVTVGVSDISKGKLSGLKFNRDGTYYTVGSVSKDEYEYTVYDDELFFLTVEAVEVNDSSEEEKHVFAGWYENKDGSGQLLSKETEIVYPSSDGVYLTGDLYCYAVFKPDTEYQAQLEKAESLVADYDNTDTYYINNKDDMAVLAIAVNNLGKDFKGKTIVLNANLEYVESDSYTPIGVEGAAFSGTFDGNYKTISGLSYSATSSGSGYVGLFGYVDGATIQDLTLSGVALNRGYMTGAFAGHAVNSKFINCHLEGAALRDAYFLGGIFGHSSAANTVENCSVTGLTMDSVWKNGAVAGYVCGISVDGFSVENSQIGHNDFSAALIGHVNAGDTALRDVSVKGVTDAGGAKPALIGTNYAQGTGYTISIGGESTYAEVSAIIKTPVTEKVEVGDGDFTCEIPASYLPEAEGQEADKVSVTFMDGETLVIVKVINEGESISALPDVSRTDDEFLGWYDTNGIRATAETVFGESVVLTAKWASEVEDIPVTPPVTPPPEPEPEELPFVDVLEGQWFYEYVEYVYVNGLMNGTSATTFEPNANMTRAMVWAILARIDGETVTGESWQTAARSWAMANGVSDGSDPNGLVTREQFATMLWRYAGEPASSYSLASFTDANSVSGWAETAMAWAVEHGIITGMTDTTLVPQGSATRAQCAAMLMRFVEL